MFLMQNVYIVMDFYSLKNTGEGRGQCFCCKLWGYKEFSEVETKVSFFLFALAKNVDHMCICGQHDFRQRFEVNNLLLIIGD